MGIASEFNRRYSLTESSLILWFLESFSLISLPHVPYALGEGVVLYIYPLEGLKGPAFCGL